MSSNLVVISVGAAFITTAYYLRRIKDKDRFWFWLAGRDYAEKQLEEQVLQDCKSTLAKLFFMQTALYKEYLLTDWFI
jgi:hypothetical protein